MAEVNGREVDLPKDGRSYRIWGVVEDLVLDRYEQIQDERMRDSYYLLREWLEPLRESGRILDAEFDYFVEQYEYYRDGFWPRIEKKHGIRRPETKPPTVVIENGEEHTEAWIPKAWERARGFLFVEKSGMAADLSPLSHHGWLIVAAQGESTRTFREAVANDDTDRPVLVVTDADFYGGGITESLQGHSDRTEHLNLAQHLEHRVRGIGLTQDDADALDLPRERDPTQSPDKWRTELNALTVLKERESIETPLLSYVVAKMLHLEIPITPKPVPDPRGRVRAALVSALQDALSEQIDEAVEAVLEGRDMEEDLDTVGEGPLMNLRVNAGEADAVGSEDLKEELVAVAEEHHSRQFWWRQSKYQEDVKEEVGADQVDHLTSLLGA
jgi:hypothetical protein